jgi:hypothetical protein
MGFSDEEINEFVRENRALIEKMMERSKDDAADLADAGRKAAHEALDEAGRARDKMEDAARQTYNMLMDPEVQRHFIAMGMELLAGVSAMIAKAPIPDKFKESAADVEDNVKKTACAKNENCTAATKMQKVQVVVEKTDDQRIRRHPRSEVRPLVRGARGQGDARHRHRRRFQRPSGGVRDPDDPP